MKPDGAGVQPDDKAKSAVLVEGRAHLEPLEAAEEASPPVVPPPGEHPPGFETIHDKPRKLWHVGTLVYTTGGLAVLFFWLLFGDFAIALRDRSVGPVVQLMLRGFGTSNLLMSILLSMIPIAITAILGPIISFKSDRMRSRWGRRIPFLLIPTPIAALSMVGMAFCPQIATLLQDVTNGAIGRTAALLTVFGVFWTLFEFAAIIAGSVFGGLINDVVPRPVIGRFYGMFRAVSLIDGMIFNWYIIGHAEEHFTAIFVWIAAVFGIGFTLMCLMVKEGDYPAPPPVSDDPRANGFFAAVRTYFRECFSKPHYLLIFAAFTLAAMADKPINWWMVMYAKQLNLNMDKWDAAGIGFGTYKLGYGGIMTITYICSLCLAYPLGSLVDRFTAIRMTIASLVLYGAACFVGGFLVRDAESFGWALLAHGILSGTYFTCSASLAITLLPRQRFAQFSSAGGLVTQVVSFVAAGALGSMLDWTSSNYRITFFWSASFAVAGLIALTFVYRRFMAMGGPAGYEAPLDADPEPTIRGFGVVRPAQGDNGKH